MFSFQRCVVGIGLVLAGCSLAVGAPPLTVVQDILFNADGTRFNGVATISWQSFEASDMSNIPAHTISTEIINGLLRVQLVPTTNALSPASYLVVYNSDGSVQFTENWAVPPSSVPVRVKDIRTSGPGTIIGGGGPPPPVLNAINISDVIGLAAALNVRPSVGTGYTPSRVAFIDATGALDGIAGNSADCIHVDGSSAPCATGTGGSSLPVFVDNEVPSGAINGVNAVFNLINSPSPAASLSLYRNGLRMQQGLDYTLSGATFTFAANRIPVANDVLLASYRLGQNTSTTVFIDAETPSGAVNGSNTQFTLTQSPNPAASLTLYRNGLRLRAGLDYNLSGNTITFLPGLAPQTGDILLCSYRVVATVG